jgi:hypothetical protein
MAEAEVDVREAADSNSGRRRLRHLGRKSSPAFEHGTLHKVQHGPQDEPPTDDHGAKWQSSKLYTSAKYRAQEIGYLKNWYF